MADVMIYKLYAGVSTTTDGAASLDIVDDGSIVGMLGDLSCIGDDALNDGAGYEISFASVSAMGTNDTRASIMGGHARQGFLTTGGGPVHKVTALMFGQDGIPVAAGERMYLHISVQGTASADVHCWLYVKSQGTSRPSRRLL